MSEALIASYWCHQCLQLVDPVMEAEIKCPFCQSGFVEEMDGRGDLDTADIGSDIGSERSLSLWAPILFGIMDGSSRRRRSRRDDRRDDRRDEEDEHYDHYRDRDFVNILRRRRRSTAILRLLQELQDGTGSESDHAESESERERERERDRDRESLILINPFNQALVLQGSFESHSEEHDSDYNLTGASFGDYFLGPGLDLLLQHLAENDPNRYGTPPAQKEAVEAMPTVKIDQSMSCSVCLEDFEKGTEAREMPCKHVFHGKCILPWLELHSSCPICRQQMPADESKDTTGSGNVSRAEASRGDDGDGGGRGNGSRLLVPVSWPFNGLFSTSGSQSSGGNSSSNPSSSASGNNFQADED